MSRVKPILAAIAILVILALIIRQITLAVRHTFIPGVGLAQVDRSTHAEQNGVTLLEIQNIRQDRNYHYTDNRSQDDSPSLVTKPDTGLWIRLPEGHFLPAGCSDSNNSGCEKALAIMARTSTGHSFPLHWKVTDFQGKSEIILAAIPAGYPDTIRWMDVSFDNRIGNTATWRITHLPPMQHVVSPPATPQTMFHRRKITAQAAIFREEETTAQGKRTVMKWDFQGTIAGPTHQWELGSICFDMEWEVPDTITSTTGGTVGSVAAGSGVKFQMAPRYLYDSRTDADSWPYLSDMRWVRMTALLKEFETYEETVTFHNVSIVQARSGEHYLTAPQNQIVKTLSGITLQMETAPSSIQPGEDMNHVVVRFRCPQADMTSLPQSPLWQRYKQPVTISLSFPGHVGSISGMPGDSDPTYEFPLPRTGRMKNDAFPVIVRQRVDLRKVPVILTLPILDKKPATFP